VFVTDPSAEVAGTAGPGGVGEGGRAKYLSLQCSYEQTLKNLARLVAVADVLKGFCCVLAANVEHNFFTATVYTLAPFRYQEFPSPNLVPIPK
jgi:hypothetical protein